MAMVQVGLRTALLIGAGVVGAGGIPKVAEILAELQEALASQIAMLARDVRQLASNNNAVIQVDMGNGGAGSALILPVAAVGAVSYCYMWWNGITFSSLMYVTKRNMANAVASMTKHLEQVQGSLAAAKKHLSQRIQHVDDKLEQQEISGQIRDQVTGAKLKIKNIGSDMDNIKNMVIGLDEKMDSIEQNRKGCNEQ
ncbi:uncharacterized protein C2845_PM07G37020 [Panicum miliaceum]|uniref:DUF1664 domain-containing protein n=1 Tax=Panicum miliaceum TaxID=4540 RepID=A0A3L6SM39_PANMI|nr:uncharacterized protein C2845_PM07G37020 [Panicum miliaceum]